MNKFILTIVFLFSIFAVNTASAQYTVIDPSVLAQSVKQVAAWQKQYSQMVDQFNQQKQMFDAMNGSRGMASLVNNPALRAYLPSDYQSILSKGYGNSADIRSQYKLNGIENTSLNPNSDTAQRFNANANQAAVNRATAEEAYRQASNRFFNYSGVTR